MGTIRMSKEKENVLKELSKTKDLKKALELMLELQGSTSMEEKSVTRYDTETGKPKEYGWKPYEIFGTDFTLDDSWYANIRLTDEVIEEIKKGPVCFDRRNKRYVAKFKIEHPIEDRYTIIHSIYLSEARIL